MNNRTENKPNPISKQVVIPKTPHIKQLQVWFNQAILGLLFLFLSNSIAGQNVGVVPTDCDFDVQVEVIQPTCQGVDDGTILINNNAATDDLTVEFLNATTPVDGEAPSLGPGLYLIELASTNCTDTIRVELAYSNPIIAPPLELVFCHPGGVINFLQGVSGGSGEYSITGISNFGDGIDYACDVCPTEIEITETTIIGVNIEDSNGCTTRRSIFAKVLDPIQVEKVDSIPDRCEGDGQIRLINVTGGGGEYKFSINGEPFQTDGSFIALQGGQEYKIQVVDQYGCMLERKVTIPEDQYVRPAVNYSIQEPSCFGESNAELRVITAGSTDLVGFSINNVTDVAPVNGTFSGLTAGRYDVFARFGESCALQLDEAAVIEQPEDLEVQALTSEASCGGNSDGEVLLVTEGGNANYEYRLNTSITTQTSNVFDNLPAGDYVAFVQDEKGCQDSIQFAVENAAPPPLWIDLTPTCPGDSSGIVIIESGKLFDGSLFYSLDSLNWFRGDTLTTEWPAGDFRIYVLKVPGNCIYTVDTSMAEVEAPVLELQLQAVTCSGGMDGKVSFSVVGGGETQYSYSLDGENFSQDTSYSNLTAGDYTLYVQDDLDCVFAYDFSLEEPPPPQIMALGSDVTCFDGSDGVVTVSVAGGTKPFLYALNSPNFQEDSTFNNMEAGEHVVLVQDSMQCTYATSVLLDEPDPILSTLEVIPETCQNRNGVVAVQPFGGTAPYYYSWSTGDSSWLVGNLAAGMYTVSVEDANGCMSSESAVVEDLAGPIVLGDLGHADCYGEADGEIALTVIGGSGDLVYAWSNGSFEKDQDSLMAGSYIVTVVDQKLCATTKAFTLFEPEPIQLSYQSGQYQEYWFINLSVAGGIGPYQYLWSNGENSEDVFELLPGTYEVLVTDDNGCQAQLEIRIEVTSTSEPGLEDLVELFPNPTTDQLHWRWKGDLPVTVNLFDSQGQSIDKLQITEKRRTLDFGYLPVGVYWLRISAKEGVISARVVKQ